MVHEYLVLPDADAAADEVDAEVAATVFVDVEALLLIRLACLRRGPPTRRWYGADTRVDVGQHHAADHGCHRTRAGQRRRRDSRPACRPRGLKALVDNAGIGVVSPMELVSLDSLRWQFEVNVFGQVDVTQEFLLLLRRANGPLVVIGSIGDRFTPPFGGPLAASKTAIASMTDAFRQELAPWGIRVVLVEPASIHTDAVDKLERDGIEAANEFPPDGRELYQESYLSMVGTALKRERRGSLPDVVADKILKVLKKSRPRAR
jgi:NAD(P)-dependent dehydrogenase (short-subunit alcohol dehydrogenase family)